MKESITGIDQITEIDENEEFRSSHDCPKSEEVSAPSFDKNANKSIKDQMTTYMKKTEGTNYNVDPESLCDIIVLKTEDRQTE